jgi:hypothetical protein
MDTGYRASADRVRVFLDPPSGLGFRTGLPACLGRPNLGSTDAPNEGHPIDSPGIFSRSGSGW